MEMSRQSEKRTTMRMNHEDGMTQTLTTEQSTLTTKELQCMMPSCRLASELRSQIPKCFRSLHTLLGLSFCEPRYQFTCCQSIKLIHL